LERNVWDDGGRRERQADGRMGRSYVPGEDQEVPVLSTEEPLMGAEPLRASGATLRERRERFGEQVRQFHAMELMTFRDEEEYERDAAREACEFRATGAGDGAKGPVSPLSHRGMARDVQADQVNSLAGELDASRATIHCLECEAAQVPAPGGAGGGVRSFPSRTDPSGAPRLPLSPAEEAAPAEAREWWEKGAL
jgi:hypothetical protein